MRNLSTLFGKLGQWQSEADTESRHLDEVILNEYMDQGWRQKYLGQESYLCPSSTNTTVSVFGDGPASIDSRPRKRKASEGMFGHVYNYFQTYDVDYRRCHGDASRDGAIILSSKRRAVNNDHTYYACPPEVPDVCVPSHDEARKLALRRAKRSVKLAIRMLNARSC